MHLPFFTLSLLHITFFLAFTSARRYTSQNLNVHQGEIGHEKSGTDRRDPSHIEKRDTQVQNENIYFQPCEAPNKKAGHCRHLKDCLIREYTENYAQNIDKFCVIDERNALYAGVCCPDDEKPITVPKIVNAPPKPSPAAPTKPPADIKGAQFEESRYCGINGKKQDRIDRGESGDYSDWPWMVALMDYKAYKKTLVHFCGAVLISNQHVISAAHCFNQKKWRDTTVRIGAYNFKKANEFPYTDYKVTAGRVHSDYDMASNENDIIILRLDRPVQFNRMIRPVCMPQPRSDINLVNRTAVVAGWGATSFGGPSSSLLLQVSVPIWEHKTCANQYTQPIQDTTICASGYEGGKDACQGDSGGPLFFQRDDGKWQTIGVVSWGIGCAQKGKPGIYTRITSFLPWIIRAQKQMA